jgi:hypothetical protein
VQRALIFHQALEKYDYECKFRVLIKSQFLFFVGFNFIFLNIEVEFNYNKLNVHIQNNIFEIYLKVIF